MIVNGVDTMIFGLDIKNYKSRFKAILMELKEKKDIGHDLGREQDILYNNLLLSLGMTGIRFYAYKLTCKDFLIAFTERPTETNSEVMVRFDSGYLWSYGYKQAYEKFQNWFSIFPGEVEKSRLSRLDICVDTDEIFFEEEDLKKFISRAKNTVRHFVKDEYYYGGKLSGFTIGRGNPMMARIYNKTNEIKESGKEWFKNIWNENGWDCNRDVWRVEFQLRRGVLKELGINSVEDYQGKQEELWSYLTNKWLILNDDKWKVIQQNKDPVISPLVREKVIEGDLKRLTNQTNGLIVSIGAYANFKSMDESLEYLKKTAEYNLKQKGTNYMESVNKRRNKYLNQKRNSG
jgi:hypothetical protein